MDLSETKNRIIALVLIVVGSFFLLLLDSIGAVSSLYDLSSLVTVPVRLEIRKLTLSVNDYLGIISRVSDLNNENDELKKNNEELLQKLSELEEYKQENVALKEQLGLIELTDESILEARVIGSDMPYENVLQINVGRNEGVEEGDIVVFGEYAVGKVERVESRSSRVLLVIAPESNIPVRGQTNRASGLAKGDVGLMLRVEDILPDEILEEGEIVVTSGVGSEYTPGLIIGIVKSIEDNSAYATQEASVEAQIDFSKLDYIFVIGGQK